MTTPHDTTKASAGQNGAQVQVEIETRNPSIELRCAVNEIMALNPETRYDAELIARGFGFQTYAGGRHVAIIEDNVRLAMVTSNAPTSSNPSLASNPRQSEMGCLGCGGRGLHDMTATLTFANYIRARAFAREWAFYSLRGYSLKGSTLELPDVTESDQKWIEAKVAALTAND